MHNVFLRVLSSFSANSRFYDTLNHSFVTFSINNKGIVELFKSCQHFGMKSALIHFAVAQCEKWKLFTEVFNLLQALSPVWLPLFTFKRV